jgi:hypothetical protein
MKSLIREAQTSNFNQVKTMNSKEKLAQALLKYRKVFSPKDVNKIDDMIKKAEDGYYSDYDSPLPTPCIQLIKDLTEIGATSLVEMAKDGEFDATEEESNEWYKREGRALALEVTGGNEEMVDALFDKTEEEKEAKEGIKGWDY